MNNDAHLVQQILTGDSRALEQLIRKHQASVYSQSLYWIRNPEDAREIVQDVFLKAYQNLASLRRPERFEAWLRQIARNECRNRLRHRQPGTRPLTREEPAIEHSAEARLIRDETIGRTISAIDRLPAMERDLLKSRYLDEIPYADLQKIHGLSYKALTMRILRAKRKVRIQLEKTLTEFQYTSDEDAISSAAIPDPTSKQPQKGEPTVSHTPFEFTAPYAAKKDGKFGYIDKSGEMIIPPQFERALGFVEGLGRVGIGDKQGYIDETGKFVIPLKFDEAHPFSEGLAGARIGERFGFIDKSGAFAVPPRYEQVEHFSGGIAAVMDDGKWGYINRKGDYIAEPQFNTCWPFNNGVAPVMGDRKCGYIDITGRPIYLWETGSQ